MLNKTRYQQNQYSRFNELASPSMSNAEREAQIRAYERFQNETRSTMPTLSAEEIEQQKQILKRIQQQNSTASPAKPKPDITNFAYSGLATTDASKRALEREIVMRIQNIEKLRMKMEMDTRRILECRPKKKEYYDKLRTSLGSLDKQASYFEKEEFQYRQLYRYYILQNRIKEFIAKTNKLEFDKSDLDKLKFTFKTYNSFGLPTSNINVDLLSGKACDDFKKILLGFKQGNIKRGDIESFLKRIEKKVKKFMQDTT